MVVFSMNRGRHYHQYSHYIPMIIRNKKHSNPRRRDHLIIKHYDSIICHGWFPIVSLLLVVKSSSSSSPPIVRLKKSSETKKDCLESNDHG